MRAREIISPTVYHGNQGGIHAELITPMWWTESKEDAINYATQNDMDGWLLTAKLKCKKPYTVKKDEETNAVLRNWRELAKEGYDCVYDADMKDWIPFYSKDIDLLDKVYIEGSE